MDTLFFDVSEVSDVSDASVGGLFDDDVPAGTTRNISIPESLFQISNGMITGAVSGTDLPDTHFFQ